MENRNDRSKHKIPEHILNNNILYCIEEYVRLDRDKNILKDRWFKGFTIEKLAFKYKVSETTIKNIIYQIGDSILLKAAETTEKNNLKND